MAITVQINKLQEASCFLDRGKKTNRSGVHAKEIPGPMLSTLTLQLFYRGKILAKFYMFIKKHLFLHVSVFIY